jgi:beta-aspartyl-dipeptidase (metallo-type)
VTGLDIGRLDAPAATLRDLVARGQPLERVLPAFTSNPATLLRLPRKGRLVPGADADLAVLDPAGAPVEVMALGRWHVRAGRAALRGMFEGPA